MRHTDIQKRFESFLKERELKLTNPRRLIFERAFATHEHFSAEELYAALKDEPGDKVSRASVYRTLALLLEGGFLEALDTGGSELKYEHVLGHEHHDHMLCLECGRIEEFQDERIEELQRENCKKRGFTLVSHDLRLRGYCKACAKKRGKDAAKTGA